jgi:hypothetical protein
MGQLGFFDADKRLEVLSARGDPFEAFGHRLSPSATLARWKEGGHDLCRS